MWGFRVWPDECPDRRHPEASKELERLTRSIGSYHWALILPGWSPSDLESSSVHIFASRLYSSCLCEMFVGNGSLNAALDAGCARTRWPQRQVCASVRTSQRTRKLSKMFSPHLFLTFTPFLASLPSSFLPVQHNITFLKPFLSPT